MNEKTDRFETRTRPLQQIVAERVDERWSEFSQTHPNLAGAIERARLIEAGVERLEQDPAFREAMEAAGRDEAVLAAAARLVSTADKWVVRTLGL